MLEAGLVGADVESESGPGVGVSSFMSSGPELPPHRDENQRGGEGGRALWNGCRRVHVCLVVCARSHQVVLVALGSPPLICACACTYVCVCVRVCVCVSVSVYRGSV